MTIPSTLRRMCDILDVYADEIDRAVNEALSLPFDDPFFDTTPGSKYQRFAAIGYRKAGDRLRAAIAHVRSLDEWPENERMGWTDERIVDSGEGPIFFGKWIVREIIAFDEDLTYGMHAAVVEVAGQVAVRLAPMMAAVPYPVSHVSYRDEHDPANRAFIAADFRRQITTEDFSGVTEQPDTPTVVKQ